MIDYQAVLKDLEEKKRSIEQVIDLIRGIYYASEATMPEPIKHRRRARMPRAMPVVVETPRKKRGRPRKDIGAPVNAQIDARMDARSQAAGFIRSIS